jgi:DNA replication and repair protein RecF
MSLAAIDIFGLRCLSEASLRFSPHLNLIHGENGSGKTSLLEAIFVSGRGRSFRTRRSELLIGQGRDYFRLFAQTQNPVHKIGYEYRRDESYSARLDGENVVSLAQLPGAFFVEVIDPEVHRLVEGAPGERRRWLDWGVFHVEPPFLEHWLRFSRALKQRNAALKQGLNPCIWDAELIVHGERVAALRSQWFDSVRPYLVEAGRRLSGLEVEWGYFRGWSADRSLAEALSGELERDRARGSTLAGPQRADVQLKMGGRAAREVLSRGQQKLVAAAMVLALLQRLKAQQATPPTLLLDDPAAELDAHRLGALVELVHELNCQLVITSLDPNLALFGQPEHMFHVERGSVREVFR